MVETVAITIDKKFYSICSGLIKVGYTINCLSYQELLSKPYLFLISSIVILPPKSGIGAAGLLKIT